MDLRDKEKEFLYKSLELARSMGLDSWACKLIDDIKSRNHETEEFLISEIRDLLYREGPQAVVGNYFEYYRPDVFKPVTDLIGKCALESLPLAEGSPHYKDILVVGHLLGYDTCNNYIECLNVKRLDIVMSWVPGVKRNGQFHYTYEGDVICLDRGGVGLCEGFSLLNMHSKILWYHNPYDKRTVWISYDKPEAINKMYRMFRSLVELIPEYFRHYCKDFDNWLAAQRYG